MSTEVTCVCADWRFAVRVEIEVASAATVLCRDETCACRLWNVAVSEVRLDWRPASWLFAAAITLCALLQPQGLRLDFGLSYYGSQPLTVLPFALGVGGGLGKADGLRPGLPELAVASAHWPLAPKLRPNIKQRL